MTERQAKKRFKAGNKRLIGRLKRTARQARKDSKAGTTRQASKDSNAGNKRVQVTLEKDSRQARKGFKAGKKRRKGRLKRTQR
jgi:hypothetical protein